MEVSPSSAIGVVDVTKKRTLSRDGLPIDAKAWTREDWQDLHEAIERVKRNVRERHARPLRSDYGAESDAKIKITEDIE